MTVKDLVKLLEAMPVDADVIIEDYDHALLSIANVYIDSFGDVALIAAL